MKSLNLSVRYSFEQILAEVVESYRMGAINNASVKLTYLIAIIEYYMNRFPESASSDLLGLINDIFQAQQRNDYLYLADLFQYQFGTMYINKIIDNENGRYIFIEYVPSNGELSEIKYDGGGETIIFYPGGNYMCGVS